jgi:hypothetical protein
MRNLHIVLVGEEKRMASSRLYFDISITRSVGIFELEISLPVAFASWGGTIKVTVPMKSSVPFSFRTYSFRLPAPGNCGTTPVLTVDITLCEIKGVKLCRLH